MSLLGNGNGGNGGRCLAWAGIALAILGAVYGYGRLYARVEQNSTIVRERTAKIERMQSQVDRVAANIQALKEAQQEANRRLAKIYDQITSPYGYNGGNR